MSMDACVICHPVACDFKGAVFEIIQCILDTMFQR